MAAAGSDCGDLDLIGDRKPISYFRDILWNGGDRVYLTVRLPAPEGQTIVAPGRAVYPSQPSWTWPGMEGKTLTAKVYSDADTVAFVLNGVEVQRAAVGEENQFRAALEVPYAPGLLKTVAYRGNQIVAQQELATTGPPVRLQLHPDRSELRADGQDLSFVTVEAVDAQGRREWDDNAIVEFSLSGAAGHILAVGNGDGEALEAYAATRFRLFHGRALVVVRSSRKAGHL